MHIVNYSTISLGLRYQQLREVLIYISYVLQLTDPANVLIRTGNDYTTFFLIHSVVLVGFSVAFMIRYIIDEDLS